jgi:hypothetical protein
VATNKPSFVSLTSFLIAKYRKCERTRPRLSFVVATILSTEIGLDPNFALIEALSVFNLLPKRSVPTFDCDAVLRDIMRLLKTVLNCDAELRIAHDADY